RLAPIARLPRRSGRADVPEVGSGAQVTGAELGDDQLIALDDFAPGNKERRSRNLDAIVRRHARLWFLPAQAYSCRTVAARKNFFEIAWLQWLWHVQQALRL